MRVSTLCAPNSILLRTINTLLEEEYLIIEYDLQEESFCNFGPENFFSHNENNLEWFYFLQQVLQKNVFLLKRNQPNLFTPLFEEITETVETYSVIHEEDTPVMHFTFSLKGQSQKEFSNLLIACEIQQPQESSKALLFKAFDKLPFIIFLQDFNNENKYLYFNQKSYEYESLFVTDVTIRRPGNSFFALIAKQITSRELKLLHQGEVIRHTRTITNKHHEKSVFTITRQLITDNGHPYILGVMEEVTDTIRIEESYCNTYQGLYQSLTSANMLPWSFPLRQKEIIFEFDKIDKDNAGRLPYFFRRIPISSLRRLIHPDDFAIIQEIKKEAIIKKQIHFSRAIRLKALDQKFNWYELVGSIDLLEEGPALNCMGMIRCIEEQKQNEEKLLYLKDKEENFELFQSEFLKIIHKGLRKPVNELVGYIQLLAAGKKGSPIQSYYQKIDECNKYFLNVLDASSDLSLIEYKKPSSATDYFILRELIRDLKKEIAEKGYKIKLHTGNDLNAIILNDFLQIRTLICNTLFYFYETGHFSEDVFFNYYFKEHRLVLSLSNGNRSIFPSETRCSWKALITKKEVPQWAELGFWSGLSIINQLDGKTEVYKTGKEICLRLILPQQRNADQKADERYSRQPVFTDIVPYQPVAFITDKPEIFRNLYPIIEDFMGIDEFASLEAFYKKATDGEWHNLIYCIENITEITYRQIHAFKQRFPSIQVIVVSPFASFDQEEQMKRHGAEAVLCKPFFPKEIKKYLLRLHR